MTSPDINRLIKQLGNPDLAVYAFESLIEQGSIAVEPLCRALNDGNPEIRWHAAKVLRRISDSRAVPLLIHALGNHDPYVADEIVRALAKIGLPAVKPLIGVLEERDPDVRRRAARTLAGIGEHRVIEPLLRGLGDRDSRIREYSAGALGKIKNLTAVEPLVHALGDHDPRVRESVVGALIKIGDSTIPLLIRKLGHANRDVRVDAIEVLKRIGHTDTLLRLILKETSLTPQQRFTALSSLERVPDVREYCQDKLEDLHDSVRQGAQAVLEVSNLLIPSSPDAATDKAELLRGAEPSVSHVDPDEILRASNGPNVAPKPPRQRGILARFWRR